MKIIAQKTKELNGTLTVPASKSQTIRGVVLAVLAKGKSTLKNPLHCQDTQDALSAARVMGAKVSVSKATISITSKGLPLRQIKRVVNTGNSGITTRFFMPLLGLRESVRQSVSFNCGRQMQKRPIAPLIQALRKLGMQIKINRQAGGYPLEISGRLLGGRARVDGLTSQYVSALLLSLPCALNNSVISLGNLHERPYVEMTQSWLKDLGVKFSHSRHGNSDVYKIPGGQKYKDFTKIIPGDFSSASCLIVAAALLPGKVVLKGLDMNDFQGDKQLVYLLKKMGASIGIGKNRLTILGGKPLRGIKLDAAEIPDLVPVLAVVGTQARGRTQITNVPQARLKETDRLRSMALGLKAMGAKVLEKRDGLVVHSSVLRGAKVKGFGDHRTVMALAVAGLLAQGRTRISGGQAVAKTFPDFVRQLRRLGAKLTLES